MLDRDTRVAILKLFEQGQGIRAIARAVRVSKNSVRRVVRDGRPDVPPLTREERLDEAEQRVWELHRSCEGNLVRVHEELEKEGMVVSYSGLTAFCRRRGIGVKPKRRVGRYHFAAGEEMQHDTSPHVVKIAGKAVTVQCASLVLCFSRMVYAQVYPRWSRFECRSFLNEAIQELGGAAGRCMLDNSSVIISQGTGKDAVPAAEMQALAERFGFEFAAHEVGDADRSARVERPFHYIENNFYKGRSFESLADLNEQLEAWCRRVNRKYKRKLRAVPLELYQMERPALKPLPIYVPEVYELHSRRVDVEGYVTLHTNRYSVDTELIGRRVEVRETIDKVRIFDGHRLLEEHEKREYGKGERITLEKHRGDWKSRTKKGAPGPSPQESLLRAQGPAFTELIDVLQRKYGGRGLRGVRKLHKIWTEYPSEAVEAAVSRAVAHGLCDLERIERMVLRRIAGDFFNLPLEDDDE
ncbi:MAG: IS21 family transposase [Myxococcota bacterium]